MTERDKQIKGMMDIVIDILPRNGSGEFKSYDYQLAEKICQALYANNYFKYSEDYIKFLKYSGVIENYVNREAMIRKFMDQFQIALRNAVETFLRDALKQQVEDFDNENN